LVSGSNKKQTPPLPTNSEKLLMTAGSAASLFAAGLKSVMPSDQPRVCARTSAPAAEPR
jgi:hypothetical protein